MNLFASSGIFQLRRVQIVGGVHQWKLPANHKRIAGRKVAEDRLDGQGVLLVMLRENQQGVGVTPINAAAADAINGVFWDWLPLLKCAP